MDQKLYTKTFLRKWRKHRNLTLEQLSSRLEEMGLHDLGTSHLSMLERGLRGYTQETLEALATALRTDVASLLKRDPSDPDAIWSVWDNATPTEQRQIVEIAKALLRTGSVDNNSDDA